VPELLAKLSINITSTFNKYLKGKEGTYCFIMPPRCGKWLKMKERGLKLSNKE
jgi:hypothetical protein